MLSLGLQFKQFEQWNRAHSTGRPHQAITQDQIKQFEKCTFAVGKNDRWKWVEYDFFDYLPHEHKSLLKEFNSPHKDPKIDMHFLFIDSPKGFSIF